MNHLVHDPFTHLLAQILSIVVVSRLLGLVMRRVGQPMVIAEVTAGIVLGPSLLGWLWPSLGGVLFAPGSLGVLSLLSQVGLVLFMFLVGIELDPEVLRRQGRASVVVSMASLLVPLALGGLLAFALRERLSEPGVSPLAFCLFFSVAMSITAFPVLARILAARGLLTSRVGALAIAAAAVGDVIGWCLLAVVVAVVKAHGFWNAGLTAVLAAGYVLAMLWGVRPFVRQVAARIGNPEALTQNVVAGILGLALLSAWVTEVIGIHALFGAFLFGAVLPKDGGFARALIDKVEDLVLILFLPLFFAVSGLRTQIGLLDTVGEWGLCGLIIAVACAGKMGAATLAARWAGVPWREASAVGVLMNTRGLMEVLVLNIGLELGVIGPTLFTMMVLMALVTTFLTTPLLAWLEPRGEGAPLVVPEVARDFHIVLCVAQGRTGPGMLELAAALRGAASRLPLVALSLVRPTERGSFQLDQRVGRLGSEVLDPILEHARTLAVPVEPVSFVSADAARDIVQEAERRRADLVLLGWHKPVLGKTRLGGTVHGVMQDAPCDVGVLLTRSTGLVRRVLVPFLGSPHDRAALGLARRLLETRGVSVVVLHVTAPGGQESRGADGARDAVAQDEGGGRVTLRVVPHDDPVEAVLAEARAGYDLMIVGMGREWGLSARAFGVAPERLLLEAPGSVLVVRARQARGERADA